MDLMPDRHTVAVSPGEGRQGLVDPRLHRLQVIRRLLAAGITASTLRAIVPEWSATITGMDQERTTRPRGLPVG